MDAIALLSMQIQWAHWEFDMTTADVDEAAAHAAPSGKTGTFGSSMSHAIFAEDNIIHGMLQGKPPLAMTTYAGQTGISDPQMFNTPDWIKAVRLDLPQFRAYAKAVAAAADAYVASLTESDLDRTVDLSQYSLGVRPVGWMISSLVIAHLHDLTGEISAIKGVQGLKGYPF